MTDATYRGMPLGIRSTAITFDVSASFDDDSYFAYAVKAAEREVRLTLAANDRVPASLKRGTPVVWVIQGERFVGRVKFRRLNVVVAAGHFG